MENTAKNFVLQLGSLITLYVSVTALLIILFGVITLAYPDAADSYWQIESATQSIRFALAMLIVFFPTYFVLTRKVNTIRRKEHGTYLTLTKWLIYLSLLAGGAVLLGDLVATLNGFLSGDLTIRFALKALSMLIIVGAAFTYYLYDVKGYWQTHEKRSIQYGIGASVVVLVTLVLGFMNIEAPSQVREMKIDNQQIGVLQDMQWRIESHYQINDLLPTSIETLYEGFENIPEASEERSEYRYEATGSNSYNLCAEFLTETQYEEFSRAAYPMDMKYPLQNSDWSHGTGEWCFKRIAIAGSVNQ